MVADNHRFLLYRITECLKLNPSIIIVPPFTKTNFMKRLCVFLCLAALVSLSFSSHAQLPSPKEHFGFNIGDDYQLATYTQTEAYFKKLAAVSDRVKLVDIGKTEERAGNGPKYDCRGR